MTKSNVYFGSFNSENYWRYNDLAKLPSVFDEQANNIVLAMDELQFVFCQKNDVILTRYSMDNTHTDYLSSIGFDFSRNHDDLEPRTCGDKKSKNKSINEHLLNTENKNYIKDLIPLNAYCNPFAVIPNTEDVGSEFGMQYQFPPQDIILNANSKIYSTQMKDKIGIPNISSIVIGTDSLLKTGLEMLKTGSFIIKDSFGVSGKGNLLVTSEGILKIITDYLRTQERKGKQSKFVVEPFLDKELDFSCQFYISPSGTFDVVSIQKMSNNGFAYQGSYSVDDATLKKLDTIDYMGKMTQIAKELFTDGYYGPVCVDSMILADGRVEVLVEINARKSMGFFKNAIDTYLNNFTLVGCFTNVSVVYGDVCSSEEFFHDMKKNDILFVPGERGGIIPFSSNTLFINRDMFRSTGSSASNSYKGRLYFTAVSQTIQGTIEQTQCLKKYLGEKGFTVQS